jgi:hypothetical protein
MCSILQQQMHAQQLPHAAHAPPIPMMPHPGLPGPPSTAASLLGLSGALGPGAHPLSMLGTKPDLHRDDVKSNSGKFTADLTTVLLILQPFWNPVSHSPLILPLCSPCRLDHLVEVLAVVDTLVLLFWAEDGDSMFLRNAGVFLRVDTALQPRGPTSTQIV